MSERLAVLARAPELGRVKTRLSPPLTVQQALALHTALVEDTLDHLNLLDRNGLEKHLLLSQELHDEHPLHVAPGWSTLLQSSGELGERLAHVFRSGFEQGVTRMVVMGSDSPTIPIEIVNEAFDHLEHGKIVIGPAEDGGYYLLGASEFVPELFQNIAWGTPEVFGQTAHALRERGIPYDTLIPWYDIDRGEDLERLRQEIAYLKRSSPDLVPLRVAAALPEQDDEFLLDSDF